MITISDPRNSGFSGSFFFGGLPGPRFVFAFAVDVFVVLLACATQICLLTSVKPGSPDLPELRSRRFI